MPTKVWMPIGLRTIAFSSLQVLPLGFLGLRNKMRTLGSIHSGMLIRCKVKLFKKKIKISAIPQ